MAVKALIVDDDEIIRTTLKRVLVKDKLLARHKIQVIEAADGREGLAKFKEHKPDLMIVDLLMPKVDGFTVIREVRASEHGANIPIAVTSGVYKDAGIAEELEQKHRAHLFTKPYELKHIAEYVNDVVSSKGRVTRPSNAPALGAREGDIAERGVPAVMLDLLDGQATGRLVLKRGRVVRQVDLYVGHPLRVSTNVREETLGHFLAERNVISKDVHRQALATAARKRIRFGEALTSLGHITAEELLHQLTEQTRYKLTKALRWPDGSWSFKDSPPQGAGGDALNITEVIVHGLKQSAELDPPEASIAAMRNAPLYLNERGVSLLPLLGSAVSATFRKAYQDGLTIDALEAAGVDRLGLHTCLDILKMCGGLSEEHIPNVPTMIADEHSKPVDLNLLFDTQSRQAPDADLYSFLFSSGGGTNAGEKPAPKVPAAQAPSSDEAPVVTLHESSAAPADESPVVDVQFTSIPKDTELVDARNTIVSEFLRVQDTTHYQVLGLGEEPSAEEIESSYATLKAQFEIEKFTGLPLGRDLQKLDQIHAAYEQAKATLLSESERKAYDGRLEQADELTFSVPSMDAEVEFRNGHEHFANDRFEEAASSVAKALEFAPQEPAYHSFLGWILFAQHGMSVDAATLAAEHLDRALELNPDEQTAHEFKGLILAHLGRDIDTALDHLEKVVSANSTRKTALDAFEALLIARKDFDRLDRRLRKIIMRSQQESTEHKALLWKRLGRLHHRHTGDHESATLAFDVAAKLLPSDEGIQADIASLRSSSSAQDHLKLGRLLDSWKKERSQTSPLSEHFKLANEMGLFDAAFCNGSAQVALGLEDNQATSFYRRYRPAFVVRAQRPVDAEMWSELLAPGDYVLVGALFSLLGPAIEELAPSSDAQVEIEKGTALSDGELPEGLKRVRAYVAHMLNVYEPRVIVRDDLERHVHLAAGNEHVLLVGRDLLTTSTQLELSFRLGRAMSYLVASRAVAASRPTRVLKTALLACYAIRAPEANIPDPSGLLERVKLHLMGGHAAVLNQAVDLVAQISQQHPVLNLSDWSRCLARTADRIGLLFSGDLPAALRYADCSAADAAGTSLIDFGLSDAYQGARRELGLSVDV